MKDIKINKPFSKKRKPKIQKKNKKKNKKKK